MISRHWLVGACVCAPLLLAGCGTTSTSDSATQPTPAVTPSEAVSESPTPAVTPSEAVSESPTPSPENDLETLCDDPQGWVDYGAGTADLIFGKADYSSAKRMSLDDTEQAMFARRSRDALVLAGQAHDEKLAEAYRQSGGLYQRMAKRKAVTLDDAPLVFHLDRVVADRCDLLIAESDLPDE
jgi:hypothetical protein